MANPIIILWIVLKLLTLREHAFARGGVSHIFQILQWSKKTLSSKIPLHWVKLAHIRVYEDEGTTPEKGSP